MRYLEVAVASACLAALAFGVALALLLPAPFTHALVERHAELPSAEAIPLAEAARNFVVVGDAVSRGKLDLAMTPDAVEHLDDVRRVISAALVATLIIAVAAVAWFGVGLARRRYAVLAAALTAAAMLAGGIVLLALVVAASDFDAFFSAFHGLFFAPGTWIFPSDSVLIQLFPEPFWTSAGAAWGALVVLVAGVYAGVAWRLRARERPRVGHGVASEGSENA